jgi:arsenate reductase
MQLFEKLQNYVQYQLDGNVELDRQLILDNLIVTIKQHLTENNVVAINFVCTHNSRRSQFAQFWATVMASYFDVKNIVCFSSGVEVTALHSNVVNTLQSLGVETEKSGVENPTYVLKYANKAAPLKMFSKLLEDVTNPKKDFIAVMTCAEADEGCPFVPGAIARIPLRYEDPKQFDNTDEVEKAYETTSQLIANEMKYVFSKV